MSAAMSAITYPGPTEDLGDRRAVLRALLDYERAAVLARFEGLSERDASTSRLPTGWTPSELVHHLACVERRWLEWGFLGSDVGDPWPDWSDGRWCIPAGATVHTLAAALRRQGETTAEIIGSHDLSEVGQPGERWDGAPPATLERVALHLVYEYARHLGHLDIVCELAGGPTGE